MDLSKFLDLLLNDSLHFSRLDELGDPFEGSTTKLTIAEQVEIHRQIILGNSDSASTEALRREHGSIEQAADVLASQYRDQDISRNQLLRKILYVNCWHASPHESAAMWKLYSKSDEAIAICTTYECLARALPEHIHLGMVQYVNYEDYIIPNRNLFTPALLKRESFSHEKEIRAIFIEQESPHEILQGTRESEPGHKINVDIEELVKQIYISPESSRWFSELIHSILITLGHGIPTIRSKLATDPVF